ncbi:MAG: hypothetical protein BGO43_01600 [Gammaproteobacteria bacterium 39-13]|nr:phosphotransferase [Gammaproteobacteria bacterium]OJV94210.1 MAG: hypothetical protein BGO43_01600 [Gammaproteobacteria bacterium 39-13]
MNNSVPITYSIIDKQYLLQIVQNRYAVGNLINIQFHIRSLNDSYLIKTNENRYILRVYRKWQSWDDVGFEVDWIAYLNHQNIKTTQLIPQKDGTLFFSIDAPEGHRSLALFLYVENISHRPLTKSTAYTSGLALAQLHQASLPFKSQYNRFSLEQSHLIDEPLKGIDRWYQQTSLKEQLPIIHQYALRAKKCLNSLTKNPQEYGPCHGDTHFGNVLFTEQNEAIWMDFECCGMGWWVYDLACFYWALKIKWAGWSIEYQDPDDIIWQAFIDGYQSIRSIDQHQWQVFPDFVIARGIWALGLHPNNIDDWTTQTMDDSGDFFLKHLELFKTLSS